MTTIRALEFYSGIGGLHLGLKDSGVNAQVVCAFDWDPCAVKVYAYNFDCPVQKCDISRLTAQDLFQYGASLWLCSPACQPYTELNPKARGEADPRSASFLHLLQVCLPDLAMAGCHPRQILVENVAGFEQSNTRQTVVSILHSLGYAVLELLLTPLQFDIPNSRLRYYLLAKQSPFNSPADCPRLWRCIPGRGETWVDPRLRPDLSESTSVLQCYLDQDCEETLQFSIPDRVLEKWGNEFDIVTPSMRRTCCFTRGYTHLAKGAGSILQMNEQLETAATFRHFLREKAHKGGDSNATIVLHPLRLRYFSPTELLRLFNFLRVGHTEQRFLWPPSISTKSKYKLIGNSVNVLVISKLLTYLLADV